MQPSALSTLRYALWRVGLRPILPRDVIQRVRLEECREPLVTVAQTDRLRVRPADGTATLVVRAGVLGRLLAAARSLPDGMVLTIVEGYRDPARQRALWNEQFRVVRRQYPKKSQSDIERITRLRVAEPSKLGSGHQTGGAVDVSLSDTRGLALDMGTAMHQFTRLTATKASPLPQAARAHRRVLLKAMTETGFCNFPGEWWHFSYGDQLWAAYSRKPNAIYGPCV